MRTPAGKECKFYYADYYRGRDTQVCRLLEANPAAAQWQPALCATCPVPEILRANACPNLALRARVSQSFFGLRRQVQVEAGCLEYRVPVADPRVGCGHCHER